MLNPKIGVANTTPAQIDFTTRVWTVVRPTGDACWISFAPVFSLMYCGVLIFALSPFYILIYMSKDKLGVFHTNQTSAQSDHRLYNSLIGKYHIKSCHKRNFTILARL